MCRPDEFGDEANRVVRQYHRLIRPGGVVLNLGAGGGRDTVFLVQHGYRVHSVDSSTEAVAYARRHLAEEALAGDVECADVRDLDLPDGSLDGVVMVGVHGLSRSDYETLYRRIGRWLRPGGALITTGMLSDDARCDELRREGVPEPFPGEFEVEPGVLRYFFPPGALPGYFPDWQIVHDEEKMGVKFRVCVLVVRKPGTGIDQPSGTRLSM